MSQLVSDFFLAQNTHFDRFYIMAVVHGRPDSEQRFLSICPSYIDNIEDIEPICQKAKKVLEKNKEEKKTAEFFKRIKKWFRIRKIRRNIKRLENLKKHPLRAGAMGELEVLTELSKLNSAYHIFCDIHIDLHRYITYDSERNLRSAQFDFIVVSPSGVYIIEVKKWSSTFKSTQGNFQISPHEQVDRANRILYVSLKSTWSENSDFPKITSLIVTTNAKIYYNPKFSFVLTTNVNNIYSLLKNKRKYLSNQEVERLAEYISCL